MMKQRWSLDYKLDETKKKKKKKKKKEKKKTLVETRLARP